MSKPTRETIIHLPHDVIEACTQPGERWDNIMSDVLQSIFYTETGRLKSDHDLHLLGKRIESPLTPLFTALGTLCTISEDGRISTSELEGQSCTLTTTRGAHTVTFIFIGTDQPMSRNRQTMFDYTIRGVQFQWRPSVCGWRMHAKQPVMEGDLS